MTDAPPSLLAAHYFLAVQGAAMMRRFLDDPASLVPRAEEMADIFRRIDEFPQSLRMPVQRYDVAAGYDRWAPRYDGPNPAVETEEPDFYDMLAAAPQGVAVDAACGTGRHAVRLADMGYQVIGVDANTTMLDVARAKQSTARSTAEFRTGDLTSLPVADGFADVVCCALALTHVADLGPVLREFARVLRPGGQALLSDMHPQVTSNGGHAAFPTGDGPRAVHYVPNLVHQVSDYVRGFAAHGLTVLECREPRVTESVLEWFPSHAVFPEATAQAFLGTPYLLLWRVAKQ